MKKVKNFFSSLFWFYRYSYSSLSFFLSQLASYMRMGRNLVDSLKFVADVKRNKWEKRLIYRIIKDIESGSSFYDALKNQKGVFPEYFLNMIKLAQESGYLVETLERLSSYYERLNKSKKQFFRTFGYYIFIIILSFIIRLGFVFFNNPTYETILLFFCNIFSDTRVVVAIILFVLYITVKPFKYFVQYVVMSIPFIGKAVVYKNLANFSLSFSLMLNQNMKVTDILDLLSKYTTNEVFNKMTKDVLYDVQRGASLSLAFAGKRFFLQTFLDFVVAGERSGQLNGMFEKLNDYYSDLHYNTLIRIRSVLEPLAILFIIFFTALRIKFFSV